MRIGEAAQASGVSPKLIRYYEDIGLIQAVGRSGGNYRQFCERHVHELRFIHHARTVGLPVEDILELLSLWRVRTKTPAEVRRAAERHAAALDGRIHSLRALLASLRMLDRLSESAERPDHPLVAADSPNDPPSGQSGGDPATAR